MKEDNEKSVKEIIDELQEKIDNDEKFNSEDITKLYKLLKEDKNDLSEKWILIIILLAMFSFGNAPTKVTNIYLGDD